MKKLLLVIIIFWGCEKKSFDCQCERIEYSLNGGEWIITETQIRKTECGQPYFNVDYISDTKRVVINCK